MQRSTLILPLLAISIACASEQTDAKPKNGNAPKGVTICPLGPLPERFIKPFNLRVFDPRTNTEVTSRDQMEALHTFELRGDTNQHRFCTESTMEVIINKSLGYPTETLKSNPCEGPNCKSFSVIITTEPGRAFYWKARIWRHDRCSTDSVCHSDIKFSYGSEWHDGPPIRSKDYWINNAAHNIDEHINIKGQPLGDESEDSHTRVEDGKFMNFGSVIDDDKINQTVIWNTPIRIENRYNAVDGELFFISKSDIECTQVLTVRDYIEKKDVVLDITNLPANKSVKIHTPLPKGLRRYITPSLNVLDKSGYLPIFAACKGKEKSFVYGADLILMSIAKMAYDEAGDRD